MSKIIITEINHKNMPSVSTAQQALMGQAYAIKIGEMKPADLDPKYRKRILAIADSMTKKELDAFASTKHKGLPHHIDEEVTDGISVSLEPVGSAEMPKFQPSGPGKIIPFLDTDAKQKAKGKKNLQNLKDYRDWISGK
jgi:hypothetical protein